MKLLLMVLPLLFGFVSSVCALPLTGSAQSDVINLNIHFSDTSAVNITKKGMYPLYLNGTQAWTYATDDVSGVTQTQTVGNGFALSNSGNAHSFAGVMYNDIAPIPLSNSIYDGVAYSASADGLTDAGTHINSYADIKDIWFFTATAPVTMTISFDYVLSASGGTTNLLGNLTTFANTGLGVGRNNTTWYDGDQTDGGLLTGTLSMGMGYLPGDKGNIYIWNTAGVLSRQSLPAPVPEPATMLLFGTGLIGLAGARLRKKK